MNILCSYKAKWRLKDNPIYVWTECKKLINTRTSREIKKTIKGTKSGYWIGKKFIPFFDLKDKIELIPKESLPF
jgi:hypothetical protein